jgi:hypothetical protein
MSALPSTAQPPSYYSSWTPLLHMPPWLQSHRQGISMPGTTVPQANTTASINRPHLQVALSTIATTPRWRLIKRKFSSSPTVHHGALSLFEFDLSIALPSLQLLLACKPRMPFLTKKAFPRLLSVPKKKFRRRPQKESNLRSPNLTHFLEMFDSICWTLVGLYVCFVFQFLMVLAFHVYIHHRSSTSDIDILIKPAISSGASL